MRELIAIVVLVLVVLMILWRIVTADHRKARREDDDRMRFGSR